ncbi:SRPBCC family protein [Lentibacter algarum]|uniref:SRPBCC family protein n=1 Tax=Lentibacter algarum TaxID=576131 RepID=UPI001C07707D|nr:SRPBCC family protein [Lentibacter algarum]MBU2981702.1 SRPBCC family protein [Lentibacter algarum]
MKTVYVESNYPVPAAELWALATDYGALAQVMQGIAAFEGLPKGRAVTGQKLNVMVSLFGKLPNQPYFMEVLECDDERMILRSSEKGAGVKSWKHTLEVTETADGSRLSDKIDIDAGWLTSIFAVWAKYLYSARHKPRLKLLLSG